MQITACYHALLREKTGCASEEFALEPGATAAELLAAIQHRHGIRDTAPLHLAVNEEFAGRDTILKEGDRIDIMPPFGGG